MPQAVRFDEYGDLDVLQVVDVQAPVPGDGEVLVRVTAAGINPGEASIRAGLLHERWPATFPSGQGSDLAGVVEAVGPNVDGLAAGDEVIGFTHTRASQAELAVVEAGDLTARPAEVPWEVAGALFVAGSTAWAAVGGVGTLAVQLAARAGATVIGLASEPHHEWLRAHGAIPVVYGDGVGERIMAAGDGRLDAFIDTFGSGYVELAIELGVAPERIDTIVDWDVAARVGAKTDGNMAGASAETMAELAALVAAGELEVPIAATYPLSQVREAYGELEHRHTLGKIVLLPGS